MRHKSWYRYTSVELLEVMYHGATDLEKQQAEAELEARKLTPAQWEELQVAYARYAKLKDERKQASLTTSEVLWLFVVPFFTPHPRWRTDDFSAAEMKRFKEYGFEKKMQQAKEIRGYGILFWLGLAVILWVIFA